MATGSSLDEIAHVAKKACVWASNLFQGAPGLHIKGINNDKARAPLDFQSTIGNNAVVSIGSLPGFHRSQYLDESFMFCGGSICGCGLSHYLPLMRIATNCPVGSENL